MNVECRKCFHSRIFFQKNRELYKHTSSKKERQKKTPHRENEQNKNDFKILSSFVQILATCRNFAKKSNRHVYVAKWERYAIIDIIMVW